jgi:hypothetical protein
MIDTVGKLYRTASPVSQEEEALVYSVSALTNNQVAPASAIWLQSSADENDFFSMCNMFWLLMYSSHYYYFN